MYIPKLYKQKDFIFKPAYLVGFDHVVYFNLDEPIEDENFSDWRVGMFSGNTLIQNFGVPTKDIISGSAYRFYIDFKINEQIRGHYYVALYNVNTNAVIFQSNPFDVIGVEEVHNYALFQFSNSTNWDNFNYETVTFENSVFLPVSKEADEFEYEFTEYREQSTKIKRIQKTDRIKFVTVETYLFDDPANDAMSSLTCHDNILINGEIVKVSEGHNQEQNKYMNVHKGQIKFEIQKYSTVNYKS